MVVVLDLLLVMSVGSKCSSPSSVFTFPGVIVRSTIGDMLAKVGSLACNSWNGEGVWSVDTIAAPWLSLVGVELGWVVGVGLTPTSLCMFQIIVCNFQLTRRMIHRILDSH